MGKKIWPVILGFGIILMSGIVIYLLPYWEADKRNAAEEAYIDAYLNAYQEEASHNIEPAEDAEPKVSLMPEEGVEYAFSDADSSAYQGTIDSILVIDKINLKKAIIRGEYNDYNLEKYYFVTADQESVLSEDNYVIYGHCSQTYGHSFNRLEELEVGDTFYLIQEDTVFFYTVNEVRRELREDAADYLETGENTVQLLSCEKKRVSGYPEKRLIIVTARMEAAERKEFIETGG